MKLKSYFAATVGSALSLARRELGGEAVLVQARPAPPEARHLGQCEVVVAAAPPESATECTSKPGAGEPAVPDGDERRASRLGGELAELRRDVQRMAALVARAGLVSAGLQPLTAELAELFSILVAAEVDAELAQDIISRLRAAGAPETSAELRSAIITELGSRFSTDSRLGRTTEPPQVVALVGPPGSGKTMTLVKLAVRFGLTSRRPTQLISMDTLRVAAAEQLRGYAAILGVGFQALETTGALAQALEEHRHKDLVLIDTPGYAAGELDAARDLARWLAARPAVDTHLVLTASTKSADLSEAVDRFAVFGPRKLVFTRLDETSSFGPLLNQAARTGLPISFLADGQQIPEDLEPATQERIVDLILQGRPRLDS